ncbi:hypothetical protein OQA88_12398 [Cercophora sp. LCS_1]
MIPRRISLRPLGRGLQPLPLAVRNRPLRRWESTAKQPEPNIQDDDKSGHISAAPQESVLFFNNLFPLKLTPIILWRPWTPRQDLSNIQKQIEYYSRGLLDPINLVRRAIPDNINVTQIVPRLKDGGAFVKFTSDLPPSEVEKSLAKALEEKPIKPWFSPFFGGIKTGLVRGRPWLEDLHRFPRSRIRVEYVPADGDAAAELSQETLYSIFRRYGKIADITPQPSDSKVLPKYAHVDFVLVRDAVMATNCMHGFVLQEPGSKIATKLRISYEQRIKPHHIWNWITSHPRVVIPIVAAFLAAFTVVVFDPIREFFVKAHVDHVFEFTDSKLYKWFKRQTSDILPFKKKKSEQAGFNALLSHRKDITESVQNGLLESTATFIVVHGPKGSGKKELIVDQVLEGRKKVLVLDCKPVVEARGEAGTIKRLAAQVGYRPIFSWANNLSSMIDLAIQSTTGVKASFSENLESQLVKILQTTASALRDVSLKEKDKSENDARISDDAYLEAHPERRTVVVIDNFLHKSEEMGLIHEKITEWAAALVQSNVAHVVFLTSDPSFSKTLSKALPDRVPHQVALGDLAPEVAKKFVVSQLDLPSDPSEDMANPQQVAIAEAKYSQELAELDEVISSLGGRLTDLQVLTRRLKVGQTPKKAVDEIIDNSASEILRMFLLAKDAGQGEKKWSVEQAWYLVKELAAQKSLRYNEVLLNNTFTSSTTPGASNGETALESLANAELITVRSVHGRPQSIHAGKPVYQTAFNRLMQDRVLKARMDLALIKELASIEAKGIDKVEQELSLLANLPTRPYQTTDRVNYLLEKLQGGQSKIQEYEKEMGKLKKVLSE